MKDLLDRKNLLRAQDSLLVGAETDFPLVFGASILDDDEH